MRKLLALVFISSVLSGPLIVLSPVEVSAFDFNKNEADLVAMLSQAAEGSPTSVSLDAEFVQLGETKENTTKDNDQKVKTSIKTTAKNESADPPQKHSIKKGDTLEKIAKKYDVKWKRIWYKNTSITDPDLIFVGGEITIPSNDEKLKPRTIPVNAPVEVSTTLESPAPAQPVARTQATQQASPITSQPIARSSSSGNTYTPGYCTWYVKNRRLDLPNNLGNADTWVSRARAQGLPTGSTPRAGAVGRRGMHVVYVERVNNDGTVFISEMNRRALYTKSTRTVPAHYFSYIY